MVIVLILNKWNKSESGILILLKLIYELIYEKENSSKKGFQKRNYVWIGILLKIVSDIFLTFLALKGLINFEQRE